jgi:hypothetical protein
LEGPRTCANHSENWISMNMSPNLYLRLGQ